MTPAVQSSNLQTYHQCTALCRSFEIRRPQRKSEAGPDRVLRSAVPLFGHGPRGGEGLLNHPLFDAQHRTIRRHIEQFDATSNSSTPHRTIRRHVEKFNAQHRRAQCYVAQFSALWPLSPHTKAFSALCQKRLQAQPTGRRISAFATAAPRAAQLGCRKVRGGPVLCLPTL